MGIQDYSTTPANNTALFPENMPRSQVNDSARQVQADIREWYNDSQWVQYGDGDGSFTITFASATSFTVNGADVTSVYHAGRRVRATGSVTGTIYGTISSSSFATNTTVNVTWDSGSLQNEALTIYIGALSENNDSLPGKVMKKGGTVSTTGTSALLTFQSTDAGAAEAAGLDLDRASASPAANDLLMSLRWFMRDDGGGTDVAAKLLAKLIDPTAGDEDAELIIQTMRAGALMAGYHIAGGIYWDSVSGGDKGTSSINLDAFYNKGIRFGAPRVQSKSGAYTVVQADVGSVVRFTTAGVTCGFDTVANLGDSFQITIWNDTASGDVTLDGNGSETIDGLTTRLLRPGDRVTVVEDGSNLKTLRGRYSFKSAELDVDNASAQAVAHGIGVIPNGWRLVLRNKTGELGYTAGDEVILGGDYADQASSAAGVGVVVDAVNVTLLQATVQYRVLNKGAPATSAVITAANWKFELEVWREFVG